MPIDLEMLVSASNSTFYNYSIDTTTYSDSTYDRSLSFPKHCGSRSLPKYQDFCRKNSNQNVFEKKRPLEKRSKNIVPNEELHGVRKKKVSFADDKGLNLVEVCEIPGAPKWVDDVIVLLIGSTRRSVVREKKWKVAFTHPPWPVDKLIDTIEKNGIALENVSIKEGDDDFLFGSVKVKNLAFEKNIFVRVTFDRWLSYVDIPCTYRKSSEINSELNKYDTFYFSSKISPVASRYEVIEFCICFQCDGKEYWDNNKGINYRLIVEYSKSDLLQSNVP